MGNCLENLGIELEKHNVSCKEEGLFLGVGAGHHFTIQRRLL